MTISEQHNDMVRRLKKPGQNIYDDLTPNELFALQKICGEVVSAGKKLDVIKKQVIYKKEKCNERGYLMLSELTPKKLDLLHMAIGIAGEAAEYLDAVSKHVFEELPLDETNLEEERGDLEFYIEGSRQITNSSQEGDLIANMEKLERGSTARYSEGVYSDEAAQARRDKDEVLNVLTEYNEDGETLDVLVKEVD